MPDRKKVIKAIEGCINDGYFCNKCDYDGCVFKHGSCEKDLLAAALSLLKEQEAVEPFCWNDDYGQHWKCGQCGKVIGANDKYCHECGKPVKHNEQQRT